MDAVLLVSFGGPEGPDEVAPFLEKVSAGREIPPARLAEVARQYEGFGGVSPINEQNRALRQALSDELAARGRSMPVYWGNRNWRPFLDDELARMCRDGIGSAVVVMTSGYSSYPGCRQYRENLADAIQAVGVSGADSVPDLMKIRPWFDHPGFIDTMVAHTAAAIARIPSDEWPARLIFTTHSIPVALAATSGPPGWFDPAAGGAYVAQHRVAAQLIAEGVGNQLSDGTPPWDLVFQSRSGAPQRPWLEPDIGDHLEAVARQGARSAVIVPIGFASDHIEVRWDLDTVAAARGRAAGLWVERADTPGTDPRFVGALAEMICDRIDGVASPSRAPGGPMPAECLPGCCPNPAGPRPAVCAADGADGDAAGTGRDD